MNIKTIAAAAAVTLFASAASAATGTIWLTGSDGQLGNGATKQFGTGPTVTASGHVLNNDGSIGSNLALGVYSEGLGVCSNVGYFYGYYCKEDHQVDGDGTNEVVKLSFSQEVTIERVWFSYVGSNDDFAFTMVDGANAGSYYAATDIPGDASYEFTQTWTGTMFGIGASERDDEWKLKKVEFSYNDEPDVVPLPASSLLLLGGLGGLVAMRRRKKAA